MFQPREIVVSFLKYENTTFGAALAQNGGNVAGLVFQSILAQLMQRSHHWHCCLVNGKTRLNLLLYAQIAIYAQVAIVGQIGTNRAITAAIQPLPIGMLLNGSLCYGMT